MSTIRKIKRYGWKPSPPDPRDFKLKHTARQLMRAFPKVFSLREKMPPIYNQGNLGSCTAQAVCALFHFRELNDDNLKRLIVPSRLFEYYCTRSLTGEQRVDSGATIRDAVKAAVQFGICREETYPYTPAKFASKPPKNAYAEAVKYQVISYARINQAIEDIKSCIFDGNPVAFGASIFSSFESNAVAKTGAVPMPKPSDSVLGGHALVLEGWSDTRGAFEVRNSWGASWADKGICYFPYQYVTSSSLCDDFWCITQIEP